MSLIEELQARYEDSDSPCLISRTSSLRPSEVLITDEAVDDFVKAGDVVALIGEFDAPSIRRMLTIISNKAIYVPLTEATKPQHEYFFEAAMVDVVVREDGTMTRLRESHADHPMLNELRDLGHAGLVLFSSGITGLPKAILHDFDKFLVRFRTPRKTFRMLNFLLFDHIGGVNTMFHTLFNKGVVIMPSGRTVTNILQDIIDFDVEVLPTTPTFLRMMLLDGSIEEMELPSLKLITYGTERMDESSLKRITKALPNVDFRQTFGMSELGIMRVKSVARDSLWMHVGGEGIETKIVDGVLKIRAQNKMIGYLNAESPFDDEGWYDSKDIVEQRDDGSIRVVGRTTEWINIGGEKVLPEVIENAALQHPDVMFAHAKGRPNPITGMHAELTCQLVEGSETSRKDLKIWMRDKLPSAFLPQKIRIGEVGVNHRFKKMG
ncbi:fatty acid--CoA ligase family protein [Litorimonas sp. RW-G-Af-16]|uniref:ANL family adenylate-forming protein n=1 Tax=Litorimonas sp. RW-G-Af-16 TaxID=3241168 RepID=UPI003AAF109A